MNGYDAPNYTQIPNILIDMDLREMGKAECKVVLAIARKTLGWHKESDRISIAQLVEMTGLTRTSVVKGTNEAVKRGIVEKIEHETGPNEYRLVVQQVDQEESSNCTRGVHLLDSQVVQQIDSQKKVVKETTTKEKDSKPLPEKPKVEDDEQETKRPANPFFNAVCKVCGLDPYHLPKKMKGSGIGTVVSNLKDANWTDHDVLKYHEWRVATGKGTLGSPFWLVTEMAKKDWRNGHKSTNPDTNQADMRARNDVRKIMADKKARGE